MRMNDVDFLKRRIEFLLDDIESYEDLMISPFPQGIDELYDKIKMNINLMYERIEK